MYIALRSFKVKSADGSYRITKPGEPLPEAEGWRNVKHYLKRQWIRLADDSSGGKGSVRNVSVKVARVPAPAPEPHEADSARETSETDVQPATEPATGSDAESETLTKKLLKKRSLTELRELSESMGLDSSGSKASLIYAILGAQ